jgi:integrase
LYLEKLRIKRLKNGMPAMKKVSYLQFKERWLEDFRIKAKGRGKLNTYDDYLTIFKNHLDPLLGGYDLNAIKPAFIKGLTVALQKKSLPTKGETSEPRTLTPKTVRNILTPLKTLLRDAYVEELTDKDLSVFVDKPKMKMGKTKFPLTQEEVEPFLKVVGARWKVFFAVAFYTGLRTGEVLGLQFEDFDLVRNKIIVRRSFSRSVLTTPKTREERVIDLIPEIRKCLLDWRHLKSPYLFCTEDGKHLDRNNIRNRIWATTLKKIGLVYQELYHTRHTFASMMMARGEDPLWVARMMGDNVQTVWRHYAIYRDKEESLLPRENEVS